MKNSTTIRLCVRSNLLERQSIGLGMQGATIGWDGPCRGSVAVLAFKYGNEFSGATAATGSHPSGIRNKRSASWLTWITMPINSHKPALVFSGAPRPSALGLHLYGSLEG